MLLHEQRGHIQYSMKSGGKNENGVGGGGRRERMDRSGVKGESADAPSADFSWLFSILSL